MSNIETYYDLARVAEITSYSPFSLRKFIKDGDLTAERWGREFRVREGELKKFIANRQAQPVPIGSRPGIKNEGGASNKSPHIRF